MKWGPSLREGVLEIQRDIAIATYKKVYVFLMNDGLYLCRKDKNRAWGRNYLEPYKSWSKVTQVQAKPSTLKPYKFVVSVEGPEWLEKVELVAESESDLDGWVAALEAIVQPAEKPAAPLSKSSKLTRDFSSAIRNSSKWVVGAPGVVVDKFKGTMKDSDSESSDSPIVETQTDDKEKKKLFSWPSRKGREEDKETKERGTKEKEKEKDKDKDKDKDAKEKEEKEEDEKTKLLRSPRFLRRSMRKADSIGRKLDKELEKEAEKEKEKEKEPDGLQPKPRRKRSQQEESLELGIETRPRRRSTSRRDRDEKEEKEEKDKEKREKERGKEKEKEKEKERRASTTGGEETTDTRGSVEREVIDARQREEEEQRRLDQEQRWHEEPDTGGHARGWAHGEELTGDRPEPTGRRESGASLSNDSESSADLPRIVISKAQGSPTASHDNSFSSLLEMPASPDSSQDSSLDSEDTEDGNQETPPPRLRLRPTETSAFKQRSFSEPSRPEIRIEPPPPPSQEMNFNKVLPVFITGLTLFLLGAAFPWPRLAAVLLSFAAASFFAGCVLLYCDYMSVVDPEGRLSSPSLSQLLRPNWQTDRHVAPFLYVLTFNMIGQIYSVQKFVISFALPDFLLYPVVVVWLLLAFEPHTRRRDSSKKLYTLPLLFLALATYLSQTAPASNYVPLYYVAAYLVISTDFSRMLFSWASGGMDWVPDTGPVVLLANGVATLFCPTGLLPFLAASITAGLVTRIGRQCIRGS